ncbi:MAG: hypothetical protein AMJ95_02625 [Omnitrophica WOR_2 bacterium SM23_72]|nr:MAG: hypothetical protein AMJ95_02625 [Omnitrophica WOR_2 bacterium SM23_72]
MKDSLSPEEKLLKLIRGEKKSKKAVGIIRQGSAMPEKVIPAVKGDVSIFSSQQASMQPKGFPLRTSIIAFLILSVLFMLSAFLYPIFNLSKVKLPEVTKEQVKTSSTSSLNVKPLESYLEGVQQRQIFRAATVSDVLPISSAAVTNTLDLFKDMTLVGIISSDPPQAVIEDKKTQKTYYLTRGQAIGDLKVDDIQEGKVIVDYLGTKYELYL